TEQKDGERVLLRERTWGKFSRSVRLPNAVNGESVEATFDNGVLTLTLPKAENALPRSIPVKALKA
ncbi:MAG: Hsp20/alpha crystallin family protein, partial [Anaerolineae bacterium]|nr:Hsp20/alpha crystallin family protein [Anaerolineae bacterium]